MADVQVRCENITVRSDVEDSDYLIALVGVSDIEVIYTPKAIIVVNKASETLSEDLLELTHELAKKIGE